MSTASFPGPYATGIPHALSQHLIAAAVSRRAKATTHVIRRHPTMQQGKALLCLGHAIEYLVDSRMHRTDEAQARNDVEASQILMGLNRQVFAECREIIPAGHAIRLWLASLFGLHG